MSMHIQAQVGDIAEKILLPGDPLRAKYIAETYLEDAVCFNEVRGMYGYTGTYKGHRVSVMGTGMGVPSISIYVKELICEYGCKTLIRIGTAGSYDADLNVGQLVISKGTCYTTSVMDYEKLPGVFAPVADPELVVLAKNKAKEFDIDAVVGLTVCNDLLYFDARREYSLIWNKWGVIASEMEGAGLYMLAERYRAKALTIMNISNNIFAPEKSKPLTQQQRERELDAMIKLALETAIAAE